LVIYASKWLLGVLADTNTFPSSPSYINIFDKRKPLLSPLLSLAPSFFQQYGFNATLYIYRLFATKIKTISNNKQFLQNIISKLTQTFMKLLKITGE